MRKLIVYLVRKHLGLKKYQYFRFSNQKSKTVYWFGERQILRMEKKSGSNQVITLSDVSLNWLLDERCQVQPLSNEEAEDYL